MYDIIESLISHSWQNNYTGDQQYIYYICGAVIILFFVVLVDLFKEFIRSAIGKR